jgi:uridine kinase
MIFFGTGLVYLVHFWIIETEAPQYQSVSFTVLQLALMVQLLILYWICIKYEAQIKNRIRPMMLGLSGDSGAGKNHLCQVIQSLLDPENCIVVEGDNYHKWERGDKNWEAVTHLNPNANNLMKMQEHAKLIARGLPILHHHYDHSTGKFVAQPPTNPSKTIIFQGLHSLYLKSLRDTLDLRIFLDPNIKVRTFWKIQRDVFERGYSLQKVLDAMAKRELDSQTHILPQKQKSDWVIELTTDEDLEPTQMKPGTHLNLYLKYTLYNDEPIAELLEELEQQGLQTCIEFLNSDLDRVAITIRETSTSPLSAESVEGIAYRLFPHLRHLTRSAMAPRFVGSYDGCNQLFLLALLSKRLETSV